MVNIKYNVISAVSSVACLLTALFSLLFTACVKEEPVLSSDVPSSTQEWIYATLWEHYFWYSQMPDKSSLNFSDEPQTFFDNLLVIEDGRNGRHYSYLEENPINTRSQYFSLAQTENSYGFDFRAYTDRVKTTAAYIEYVVLNTPASRAGLQRGDWIIEINGAQLNGTNYYALLSTGGAAVTLTVATLEDVSVGNNTFVFGNKREVALDAAESIEDNPVYLHKVIEHGGKKVGYMVYNHFTPGKTANSYEYDEALREVSADFKAAGINELVLDLRYNNGGTISSAILLCNILAPADVVNRKASMCKLVYNDKQKPREYTYNFGTSLLSGGKNLDLGRLYVLTSNITASASEMLINCLRPYYTVVLTGTQTVGKNVGSNIYKSSDKQWEMHPITSRIFNSKDESDYQDGFAPDIDIQRNLMNGLISSVSRVDLGDEREILLHAALQHMDGTYAPTVRSSSPDATYAQPAPVFHSFERRATNGVVIDR
ncbi:MAG: PDZ domain-containing protein [Tannerella sp.]|jgi:C-terminal processing protease CtpA/Prc|nr:PDZ domain-containing protein [Tannerella sp.]